MTLVQGHSTIRIKTILFLKTAGQIEAKFPKKPWKDAGQKSWKEAGKKSKRI